MRRSLSLLVLLLAACGAQPAAAPTSPAAGATTIKVVTTMSILNDMIIHVGGERVSSKNIIPLGAGPEDYQPAPQDTQAIADADIVFYNGHGLEDWLTKLFDAAGRPSQPRIAVSDGLQAVDVGGAFAEGNPHFWMSAAYGAQYVEKIRDGLIAVDPAGSAVYTANAAAYRAKLLALNEELKQLAATVPPASRKMVTNHDAFPYFAKEYGFTIVGDILGNPEGEPSAGDLAALVEKIKAEKVKAVFSEAQFNQQLTETIAKETGAKVVAELYTDTLGDSASGVTSYIDMLRYDVQTVVNALK